ncbi:hypothetical protein [Oscillatoria sp. HE19RPO]|nr:hypothetical protein [Oscillatoria sp. HE19RPO]
MNHSIRFSLQIFGNAIGRLPQESAKPWGNFSFAEGRSPNL